MFHRTIAVALCMLSTTADAQDTNGHESQANDSIALFLESIQGEWEAELPVPDDTMLSIRFSVESGPTSNSGVWRTTIKRESAWELHALAYLWCDYTRDWHFAQTLADDVAGDGTLCLLDDDHLRADWLANSPDGTPNHRFLDMLRTEDSLRFIVLDASDPSNKNAVLDVSYTRRLPDAPLYFAATVDGNSDIWVFTDGESRRLTTDPGLDNWPVPSPDGRWVAFQSQRDGSYDIFVMPSDGSAPPRKLASGPSHDGLPVWSPDSSEIAFFSNRGLPEPEPRTLPGHIYRVSLDGTGLKRLTDEPMGSTVGPSSWSPDGRSLLLSRRNEETGLDIYRLDLETGTEHRLTRSPEDEYGAQYSPDGSRITYYLETDEHCDVAISDYEGTERTVLTNDPGWHYVQGWSPDGAWVAVLSYSPDYTESTSRAIHVKSGQLVTTAVVPGAREFRWGN